ncbi:MAG TPA: sigma-70 family RNA polymerase sigma factor [Puia sp.]|nr:sigma-70 family RNA polymerase sigma factor [Puia sp.]
MFFLKDVKNSTAEDQELVQLYKQDGDIQVLAALYQRYMDLIYAVCLKYLKEQEAAKDAVMAIFEELVSKLLKHEVVHFKGWLYTVAKNFCLMQLRSQKQMHIVPDQDSMQLTENLHLNGVFEKEEQLNQLSKCIDALSPDQKQIVQLFYLHEKCYKEIAVITDSDWNKVRSMIQNARRNLKNCMEKNIIPD